MKKVALLAVMSLVALGVSAQPALAVPAFQKFFDKTYVEGSENESFTAAVKDAKCNLCHYGKSKKNRNDYGKALGELLDKDNYKADRIKAEPDVVDKELKEAFEKVAAMKSSGGETFGALIKAGKLPGTAPEGE